MTSAQDLITQGNQHLEAENYKAALDCFNQALKLQGKDFATLKCKCTALFGLEKYGRAVDVMNQALQLNLNSSEIAEAAYFKARCNTLRNKHKWVLSNLRKAFEYQESLVYSAADNPEFEPLHSNPKYQALIVLFQGIIENYDENYEGGLENIEQALTLNPNLSHYFVALNSQANALAGLEKYEEAIAFYEKAKKYPADEFDSYTAYINQAFALSNLGRDEAAIAAFDSAVQYYNQAEAAGKALRDRTQLASFWEEPGWDLVSSNQYQEALQFFEKALKYKSDYAWGIYGKACCYAGLNQVDSALESLKRAFEIEPAVQADANKDQEWESVRSDSQFQAIFNPESGDTKMTPRSELKELLDQGAELVNSGEYEAAISTYDKALEIDPDSFLAMNEKAGALNGLERYQEALELIEKAIQIKPDYYQSWGTKGRILANGFERSEEALSSYNKALEFNIDLQSDRAILWSFKAEALYPLERYQESVEAVDRALELDLPSALVVYAIYLKASCCALLQQEELALESLKKAVELDEMCKDWAKDDSDWTRLHSNPKFQAIVGVELTPESVQQFLENAVKDANDNDESFFVSDLGSRVDIDNLPETVKQAYGFYKTNVEDADWGSVGVYKISVDQSPVYAVSTTTDGDDCYLEVYSKTGEQITCASYTTMDIEWKSQADVRSSLS